MPISTRSMKRELPPPVPRSTAKPTNASKPPRVPAKRVTKTESEPGPSISKKKAESRFRGVDTQQAESSTPKKQRKLVHDEVPLPQIQFKKANNEESVASKIIVNSRAPAPVDNSRIRTELSDWSNFYSNALSERCNFLKKIKDATESFDQDFQLRKELLVLEKGKIKSSPKLPQKTPLNKKMFQTIPSSALRDPGKIAKLQEQLELLSSPEIEQVAVPKVTNETLNTNKTVACVEAMEIDNTFDVSTIDTLNVQSPLLFESESNTLDDVNPEEETPGNSIKPTAGPISHCDKVIRAHSNKRVRSPDCPKTKNIDRLINKIPPSFEFGVESPLRKKVIIEKDALGCLNEETEENVVQPNVNATYVQKKVVTTQKKLNYESEDEDESELLFTEDESSCIVLEVQKPQNAPAPVKSATKSVSIASSVSALVEQFEKKKAIKAANVNGPNHKNTKIEGVVQHKELIQKGVSNATFVMDTSTMDVDVCSTPNKLAEKDDQLASNFTMEETTAFAGQNYTFNRTTVITTQNDSPKNSFKANTEIDSTFVVNKAPSDEAFDRVLGASSTANCNQTYYVKDFKPKFANKLSTIATDSEGEKSMGSISSKKSAKVSKQNTASTILEEATLSNKIRSDKPKSTTSQSSSSSGSMKSAVSQPSLNKITTKMGTKNTVMSGSAGSVYEKQKSATNATKESDIRKRLLEKEEEAAKRKLEFDMRKIELQKKKNEEWKRKAETMKANEKKNQPTSKMMPGGLKAVPGANFAGKQQGFLKPNTGFQGLAPKFNPKLMMPSNAKPCVEEQSHPDDSFCTAADGYSFLEVTEIDPANNYDITRYEDIDEECRHRDKKPIPAWCTHGEQTTLSLFRQIPYENMNLPFFPQIDKYKLYPHAGK